MSATRSGLGEAMFSREMVLTPWGRSDRLRARMLDSGPRATPRDAEQNQRERLFGSMVACCAEQGYVGTTVADLIATAGVSRRDFYKHFVDKEACFLSTLDEILRGAARTVAARLRDEGSWEARARSALETFL